MRGTGCVAEDAPRIWLGSGHVLESPGRPEVVHYTDWTAPVTVPVIDAASAASASRLISSFNSLPGLKYGTFFGGTSTLSPVFGFLPLRGSRLRSRKLPKPRSSIFSPRCSASMMLLNTVSTMTSECFLVRSDTRDTSSTSSALVMLPPGVFKVCSLIWRVQKDPPYTTALPKGPALHYRFLKWSPRVAVPVPSLSEYCSQSV